MYKIGKFFGADIYVSIYNRHDQIIISPKEERLFMMLMEWEQKIKDASEFQEELKLLSPSEVVDEKRPVK